MRCRTSGISARLRVVLLANYVVLVQNMHFDVLQCSLIACEMIEIIPSHCVDVGLANFFSKLPLMPGQKGIKVFVSEKSILLNDLSINVW